MRVARVSKPMKLITLRIDEEEKARLEQLAERGNVTLSRALREGAGLYFAERQAKSHRGRGGEATFHGVRRDPSGRPITKPSKPTPTETKRLRSLRKGLYEQGLGAIRAAWDDGVDAAVVLGAVGQWLSLVGRVYVSNGDETGWDWFLRDYCGYDDETASQAARDGIRGALIRPGQVDVPAFLDRLDAGFRRFLNEAEHQELVRRAVLPTWHVLQDSVA